MNKHEKKLVVENDEKKSETIVKKKNLKIEINEKKCSFDSKKSQKDFFRTLFCFSSFIIAGYLLIEKFLLDDTMC